MEYKAGTRVNLEKALQLTDRLNGHIVSGHVDGVGIVTAMDDEARSTRCEIEIPNALLKYMCIKGSVCIDGVSLTINEIRQNRAGVNIIPFTRFNTVVSDYRPGRRVNIEVDIVARYLESLINTRQ
jgi:riboflavin synthase